MENLSFKIPEDLQQRLASAAKRRKTSKAAIAREALEAYLTEDAGVRKGSVLDLARDLAGSCSGPEDLSINKKYLEGYGE